MPTLIRLLLAILSVSALCCRSKHEQNAATAPSRLPSIVATVDSHPVGAGLYEIYLDRGMRALNLDASEGDDRRQIDQLKEGVVLSLIDKELLRQEAERRGIATDQHRIDQRLAESVESFGGKDRFEAFLTEHGVSAEDFRKMLQIEETESLMADELAKAVVVDPAEVQRYYSENSHRAEFMLPERVHIGRIFLAANPATIEQQLHQSGVAETDLKSAVAAAMEERRKLAGDLHRKLVAGVNFAQLAKQHADDLPARDRSGDLGWLERDVAEDRQQLFLFALPPASVSDVIQTRAGFEIYKVWEHQLKRVQTLEEAGPHIADVLGARKRSEILTRWLEQARSRARIEVAVAYRFGDIPARFPFR